MRVCIKCGMQFAGPGWKCPACGFSPDIIEGFPFFASCFAEAGESYDAEFYEHLAGIEENNFWFRSRNLLILYALHHYFPAAEKFLEIGCGTGFVLTAVKNAFPQMSLCGSDLFSAGLAFAASRCPNAGLLQMDARNIPFMEEFDVIGAFDVLEHIEEDKTVLAQMFRALKKGGGILITVPQHAFLWSGTDEYALHVRRYSMSELRSKVEDAGFRIARTTSFISLLLPLMALSRLKKRKIRDKFGIIDELRMGRTMNMVLEKILDFERAMIRSGINFPVGGSLFLVAGKN